MRLYGGRIVICVTLAGLGQIALAQMQSPITSRQNNAGRPSDNVGLIGGRNTRTEPLALGGARRQVSDAGGEPQRMNRGSRATQFELPAAFQPARTGTRRYGTSSRTLLEPQEVSAPYLAQLSGLTDATNLEVPEGGIPRPGMPGLSVPLRVNRPDTPSFAAYFGLQPAPADDAGPRPAPQSMEATIELKNAERLVQLSNSALAAFKAGTSSNAADRGDSLAEAMGLFSTVRMLDRESYLPSLLSAHIALEREQLSSTFNCLAEAVERHPTVFQEKPDVASYFGDPERFRRQMRRYQQTGQYNQDAAEAFLLDAYCSWMLDDPARARQALSRAQQIADSKGERASWRAIRLALDAAVR